MNQCLFKLGNYLYKHCFCLYKPLYSLYKALSDRKERAVLRRLIASSATVIDVGANVGVYTQFLSRLVGKSGKVVAFEPSPENFKRLRQVNVGGGNIQIVQAAISDRCGKISLYISSDLNVDHCTYDSGEGRRQIGVSAICLDDYFAQKESIDFIKIDVQGYEYSVLKGARRILEENPKIVVLMEFWPYGLYRAGISPKELLFFINELGFSVFYADSLKKYSVNRTVIRTDLVDQYCNLILMRQKIGKDVFCKANPSNGQ